MAMAFKIILRYNELNADSLQLRCANCSDIQDLDHFTKCLIEFCEHQVDAYICKTCFRRITSQVRTTTQKPDTSTWKDHANSIFVKPTKPRHESFSAEAKDRAEEPIDV